MLAAFAIARDLPADDPAVHDGFTTGTGDLCTQAMEMAFSTPETTIYSRGTALDKPQIAPGPFGKSFFEVDLRT